MRGPLVQERIRTNFFAVVTYYNRDDAQVHVRIGMWVWPHDCTSDCFFLTGLGADCALLLQRLVPLFGFVRVVQERMVEGTITSFNTAGSCFLTIRSPVS